MMKTTGLWILGGLLLASPARAEVRWLQLYLLHEYSDGEVNCKATKPGGDIVFGAEMDGETVKRVVMSNYPYQWAYQWVYRAFELSPEQNARVEFHRDPRGNYWLKSLPLREDQMRFLLDVNSRRYSLCEPPQPLATLAPAPMTHRFSLDGIDEGVGLSYTQKVTIEGTRKDGRPYQGVFRLSQRQYQHFPDPFGP